MASQDLSDLARHLEADLGAVANFLRQSPALRALASLVTANDIEGHKRQLELLVRMWQPNIDTENARRLADDLWRAYERWVVLGRVDPTVEDLYPELSNTLINAASHAHRLYEFIHSDDPKQATTRSAMRARSTALRVAATMRDSLDQVAQLVRGEELDEPEPREFTIGEVNERDHLVQDVAALDDMLDVDEHKLRMALAHQAIKRVTTSFRAISQGVRFASAIDTQTWQANMDDLQEALDYLSGAKPLPDSIKRGQVG
jgi:LPS sulfotransferase NodH